MVDGYKALMAPGVLATTADATALLGIYVFDASVETVSAAVPVAPPVMPPPTAPDDDSGVPIGPLVGGIVGGVAGVALLGFIAYKVMATPKGSNPAKPEKTSTTSSPDPVTV